MIEQLFLFNKKQFIKIAIWIKKIDINLKYFEVTYINRLEKPISIFFRDNNAFIKLIKSISNVKKIKHIDIIF